MTFKEQVLQIIREHEKTYNPVDDYVTTNELGWLYEEIRSLNENPWHTGTPTEEGCFYVLQCKGHTHPEPYHGVVVNGKFSAISWDGDLMPLPPDLIAWRKIEPYKEKEDGHID